MSVSFRTRKLVTGGWYIHVDIDDTTVDFGMYTEAECAKLAATLRETAEEIAPIDSPDGSVCHACDGTGIVPSAY